MGLFNKKEKQDDFQIDTSKLRMDEGAIFGQAVPTSEFSKDNSFGNGYNQSFDSFGENSADLFKNIQKGHKEKCEELRKIRKNMATTLGIPSVVRDEPCNYNGHCSGTCPACYMEERALMDRIYELSENGMINLMYSKEIKDLENKIEHDLWEASVFEGDMEGEIADGFGIDDNKDTDSTEETKE
jgi:hypothetical protein